MIQTAFGINGNDCTFGDGNTAEEYEAIAVALLRTAEAIRNREEGRVECLRKDGKVLASVLIHHCGAECDEDALADPVTIEEVILCSQLWPVIACHFTLNDRAVPPRVATVERHWRLRKLRSILP